MEIKNVFLFLLLLFSGCGSGPDTEEYIGKYEICLPEEYLKKKIPSQNAITDLDSFSINFYRENKSKIMDATLEIFADSTFKFDGEILNDKSGTWKKYYNDELGGHLSLKFNNVKAAAYFHYEREGYRICVFPMLSVKGKIPTTMHDPEYVQLLYKKMN